MPNVHSTRKPRLPDSVQPRFDAILAKPSPQVDLTELPDEDVMTTLDLRPDEFTKFHEIFTVALWQLTGLSISKACDRAGVARATFYSETNQNLYAKAQRILMNRRTYNVRGMTNQVFDAMPELVDGLINDLRTKDVPVGEKVKALEWMHLAFVQHQDEGKGDDLLEKQYLHQQHNFNPSAPLMLVNGDVYINGDKDELAEIGDVLDVVAHD